LFSLSFYKLAIYKEKEKKGNDKEDFVF